MSTVPPQTHFMTKILASFTFLIVQSVLIFLYGLIAGFISTQILGSSSSMSVSEIIGQFTETDSEIIASVLQALPGALVTTLLFTIVGGLFFMIFIYGNIGFYVNLDGRLSKFPIPIYVCHGYRFLCSNILSLYGGFDHLKGDRLYPTILTNGRANPIYEWCDVFIRCDHFIRYFIGIHGGYLLPITTSL